MATLENLPEEVLIEILSRLPVESLLRFKSVRKSWYALINDPHFVGKHFSNSLHRNHLLLRSVAMNHTEELENQFSTLIFPLSVDRSESVTDEDYSYDRDCFNVEDYTFFQIYGDSHGLICLSSYEAIFLCNPFTREIRKLPPSISPNERLHGYNPIEGAFGSVGFGYDAKSEDFSVVRIVYFFKERIYRVEIYDLSKDRWREIENLDCGHLLGVPSFEICHEGTYYWWMGNKEERYELLEFDLREEVFGRLSLPGEVRVSYRFLPELLKCKRLGVLNGSIVLLNYLTGENENTMDIWEMEKNECGSVSWLKVLTIGIDSGIGMPFMFVSSDEVLVRGAKENQLILYNIRTKKFKELPINEYAPNFISTLVVESLVSLKGGNYISYGF